MATRFPLLLAGLAASLSGCVNQGEFPSLAPRAAERELSGEPVPPCLAEPGDSLSPADPALPSPPPDDPQLSAEVERLLGQARGGERAFAAILPAARRSVGRAGPAGSELWIEAQQDVSRLEAARAPTVQALADLDMLSIRRSGDSGTSAADRERVLQATQQVRALAEDQRSELARLVAALSQP